MGGKNKLTFALLLFLVGECDLHECEEVEVKIQKVLSFYPLTFFFFFSHLKFKNNQYPY